MMFMKDYVLMPMITLRDIIERSEEFVGKRVRLRVRVLGRKYCGERTFMRTRSDVTVADETTCLYSDPIPMSYRRKLVEGVRLVEEENGRIRLARPRILAVIEDAR